MSIRRQRCDKRATHEVRSSGTSLYGCFCKKHAEKKKERLEEVHQVIRRRTDEEA